MKSKVEYIDGYGGDLLVVNAARCSFNKWRDKFVTDQMKEAGCKGTSDEKLIQYLAEGGHTLPFQHPHYTLRVTAPIFVARQLGKHQVGLSWSEVSRRYVSDTPHFYTPSTWRKRPPKSIKQGSIEDGVFSLGKGFDAIPIEEEYQEFADYCEDLYYRMLAADVCPEQARMVLPQSMMTTWIWTGSLLAWVRIYNLRIDPHSQKEVQEVAVQIGEIIKERCPISWTALTTI